MVLKLNATIDDDIFYLFEEYCISNDKNRSAVVERLIKEFLEKEGKIKKVKQ